MPNSNNPEVFDIEIAYSTVGSKDVLSIAQGIDSALDALRKGANIDLEVDVGGDSISDLSDRIARLQSEDINLGVNLDDAQIQSLSDLSDPQNIKINVDDTEVGSVAEALAQLDTSDPNIKIKIDPKDVDDAKTKVDRLSTLAKVSGRVAMSQGDVDALKSKLEEIKSLSLVNIAFNIPSTLQTLASTLVNLPGVGAVQDTQQAENILRTTGDLNPEELALAQNLYTNAFAGTITEAALFINQMKAIGIEGENLEAAAVGAYQARDAFRAIGKDADLSQIAIAQNSLVANNLAEDYAEAKDLIATGVLSGADRRDDFLDTIIEYGSAFRDLGITGEQALNAINSGIDSGFDNTDRIADLFREFRIRAGNESDTAAQDALKAIGLGDEAELFRQGELSGVEFFNGVIEGLKNAPADKRLELSASIFGSQSEDFGTQAALGIDPITATFDTIEGRAEAVSTLINNNLGTAFTELFNTINVKAGDLLSSDSIDLPGKIEAIKKGIGDALDTLESGGTVSEAIEVGLKPVGFDDEWEQLERILGNLVISLLDVVAGIQEATGHRDAASATQAEVARLSQQQLASDLQIANPQETEGLIRTAQERGVSGSGITEALKTAVQELIASGDLAGAKDLTASLEAIPGAVIEKRGFGGILTERVEVPIDPTLDPEKYQALVNEIAASKQELGQTVTTQVFDIDPTEVTQLVDDAVANAQTAWQTAINSRDFGLAQKIAEDLGDESFLAETFRRASLGGDLGVAEAIVQDLSDNKEFLSQAFDEAMFRGYAGVAQSAAGLLEDPALIEQANALATDLRTEIDEALKSGDTGEAGILAQKLGDEELLQQIDALKDGAVTSLSELTAAAQQAATDSGTAMDEIGDKAGEMDATVTEAISGNTVITEFQNLSAAAGSELTAVITQLEAINAVTFDSVESEIQGLISLFESLKTVIESTTIAIAQTNAQAASLGGTVNNSSTTLNQTNIVQSNAQAEAVGQITADSIQGLPK